MLPLIAKLAGISSIDRTDDFGDTATGVSFMVRTAEMFVPLEGLVDAGEELRKMEEALARQRNFLAAVQKKLGNASFTAHAPEAVVALEHKKEQDSLSKIESLESAINALKNNR